MNPFLQTLEHGPVLCNDHAGGYLILLLLIPTGIYFIFRLRLRNVPMFRHTFMIVSRKFNKKEDSGDVNHFKALTTALSATVGTDNIVVVSLSTKTISNQISILLLTPALMILTRHYLGVVKRMRKGEKLD